MSNLKLDKMLNEVDWSQVGPQALELAVKEYNLRKEQAEELAAEHDEDFLYKLAMGAPLMFVRKKHAARLALEAVKAQ